MPFFSEGQDPLDRQPRGPDAFEGYVRYLRARLVETVLKLDGDPNGAAAFHMKLVLEELASATRGPQIYIPRPPPTSLD